MIEAKNLIVKKYKKTIVEIDAKIDKRQITAIIGPNGCGKTTFLRAISGIVKYTGEIIIDGKPVREYSSSDLAKRVAYMPQSRYTPQMTVEEYLMCARYPYMRLSSSPSEKDISAVESAMEQTGITELRERQIRTLSGGERQKVYFAFALSQETDVMLLDEPTTYLDIDRQYEMMELMKKAKDKKTVVAVLHQLSLALEYADKIIVMDKGRIVSSGTKEEIITSGVLGSIYGVEITPIDLNDKTEYHITKKKPM